MVGVVDLVTQTNASLVVVAEVPAAVAAEVDVNMQVMVELVFKILGELEAINTMLLAVVGDTLVLTAVDLVNILLLLVDLVGLVLVVMVLFVHMEQPKAQQILDRELVLAVQELEILGL
jgi:hypothetical protein